MLHPSRISAGVVFILAMSIPWAAGADAPVVPSVATPGVAWEVRTEQIPSKALGRDMPATVVLPSSYAKHPETRFPVVYLLHGYGDAHTGWIEKQKGDAAYLAERHQVILVCPSGGQGWYMDAPEKPESRFETHVASEVVAYVDAHFRTRARRDGRAIAGLSMGGHGALSLAMRHSDVFSAAGSMSGGVDLRPFSGQFGLQGLLGDPKGNAAAWAAQSVVCQATGLEPGRLLLFVDCGTEDFFLAVNRDLHRILLERKVPHVYTERPGVHTWAVWREAVQPQMQAFSDHFARMAVAADKVADTVPATH